MTLSGALHVKWRENHQKQISDKTYKSNSLNEFDEKDGQCTFSMKGQLPVNGQLTEEDFIRRFFNDISILSKP